MRARVYLMITIVVLSSLLVVLSSLLAACAPSLPTVAPTKPAAAPAPTTAPLTTQPAGVATTAPPAAATKPVAAAPPSTPAPVTKIKRGGVLRVTTRYSFDSLDPHLGNSRGPATNLLFDTLLGYDLVDAKAEKFEIRPRLVESYKVVDPTTFELKIQKGVKAHDDTAVDASLVQWNLERAIGHPKSMVKVTLAAIKSVQAVDAQTLRLNLKAPSAVLPLQLTPANPGLVGIVSKEALDKLGEDKFGSSPVGTGPMKLKEWERDVRVVLEKFPGYWEKGKDGQPLPYLDGYRQLFIPDSTVALMEFRAGNVEINPEMELKDVALIQGHTDLMVQAAPISWRTYPGVWVNPRPGTAYPMSNNPKLRYAAQHAIDRDGMAKALGFGMGRPSYYPFWFPGNVGYDESLPRREFDLNRAKLLMAEAGFANGLDVEAKVIFRPSDVRPLEMLQAMLAKIDIRLKITAMDRVPWIDDGRSGRFELLAHGWFQRADPHIIQVSRTGSPENWGGYSNPAVDKLWEQAEGEYDNVKRAEIYKQIQRLEYEDSYFLTAYMYQFVNGVSKRVRDFTTEFNYRYVWLD